MTWFEYEKRISNLFMTFLNLKSRRHLNIYLQKNELTLINLPEKFKPVNRIEILISKRQWPFLILDNQTLPSDFEYDPLFSTLTKKRSKFKDKLICILEKEIMRV